MKITSNDTQTNLRGNIDTMDKKESKRLKFNSRKPLKRLNRYDAQIRNYKLIRRMKRGNTVSNACSAIGLIPPGRHPDDQAQKDFMRNPVVFFQQNAISTHAMSECSLVNKVNFADINSFILIKDSEHSYSLYPNAHGNRNAILGYWVNTKQTILINPFDNNIKFIFTPELQGCSLYIRYHRDRQTMEVYHHYRQHDARALAREDTYDQEFDQVIKWDDYSRRLDYDANLRDPRHMTFYTPLLFRDQGKWYFASQIISHTKDASGKIVSSKSKGLSEIIPINSVPVRAPTRNARSVATNYTRNNLLDDPSDLNSQNEYLPHDYQLYFTTSGSSRLQSAPIALIRNLIDSLVLFLPFNYVSDKSILSEFFAQHTNNAQNIPSISTQTPELSLSSTCMPGAWDGSKYNMDAKTCITNNGIDVTKIMVFPKISSTSLTDSRSTLFDPIRFVTSDYYFAQSCNQIDYNGDSSIYCQGEKTNIIYSTQHQTYSLSQLFATVDNILMLLPIFISWFDQSTETNNSKPNKFYITPNQYEDWQAQLETVSKKISILKLFSIERAEEWNQITNSREMEILDRTLAQCQNDYELLKRNGEASFDKIENLTKNISGLDEYTQDVILTTQHANQIVISPRIYKDFNRQLKKIKNEVLILELFSSERNQEWQKLFNVDKTKNSITQWIKYRSMGETILVNLKLLLTGCEEWVKSLRAMNEIHIGQIDKFNEKFELLKECINELKKKTQHESQTIMPNINQYMSKCINYNTKFQQLQSHPMNCIISLRNTISQIQNGSDYILRSN